MLKRIFAVFYARNLEFLRDKGTLAWNLVLPVALVFGLATVFGEGGRNEYTVGVVQQAEEIDTTLHPFLETPHVRFVAFQDLDEALVKVERHQIDLLVQFEDENRYWVNPDSSKGYFVEKALLQSDGTVAGDVRKDEITGDAIRYADWVLPGILGMNMMFSSLFGVGYVVVRYRKNGFLKRLHATPLSALEFIIAQVGSRLALIMVITVIVYTGTHVLLDTRMEGSHLTLLLIAVIGAMAMISLGLLVAARVTSEELAGGLLNLINWPMMLLSGVWFSLEGAGTLVQQASKLFPLTHVLDAARAVMLDGATLLDVGPTLMLLTVMTAVFLVMGAAMFRWGPK